MQIFSSELDCCMHARVRLLQLGSIRCYIDAILTLSHSVWSSENAKCVITHLLWGALYAVLFGLLLFVGISFVEQTSL